MPFKIGDIVKQSNRRENVYGPGFFFVADTFDICNYIDGFQQPGDEPSTDEFRRYVITDPYNLHASYGTIGNVGTGDIVQAISDEERPVKSFTFEVIMSAANTGDLVGYSNGQIGSRVFNVSDLSSYIFNGATWENVQVGPEGSSSSGAGNTYYGGTGLTLTDFVANVGQTFSIDSSSILHVAGISLDGAITFADGFTQSHVGFGKVVIDPFVSGDEILASDYQDSGYSTLVIANSNSITFDKSISSPGSGSIPLIFGNIVVDNSTIEVDSSNGVQLKNGGVSNTKLANSSITISNGNATIVTGGAPVELGASVTIDVNADNSTLETTGGVVQIKDNGITGVKIVNGAVTNTKLGDSSVGTGKIQTDAVNASKILSSDTYNFAGITTSGITSDGPVNLQDNDLIRPNLKDYSEEVKIKGNLGSVNAFSFADGNVQTATVNDNIQISFSNEPPTGKTGTMTIILTNGGSSTVTYESAVKWPGGVAPTLSSLGTDILSFVTVDGGTTIYGFVGGVNLS